MAEKNIKMRVKTSNGYDVLYPQTKSDLVEFNNSGSNLKSKTTESALYEVDKNMGVLSTLKGIKTSLVSAINEIHDKFLEKKAIVDNLSSSTTDAPLSANMGKQLNDSIQSFGVSCKTGQYATEWTLPTTSYHAIGNALPPIDNDFYLTKGEESKVTIKQKGQYLVIGHVYCKNLNTNVYPSVWASIQLNGKGKIVEAHLMGKENGFCIVGYLDVQPNDTIDLALSCDKNNVKAYAKSNTLTVIKLR